MTGDVDVFLFFCPVDVNSFQGFSVTSFTSVFIVDNKGVGVKSIFFAQVNIEMRPAFLLEIFQWYTDYIADNFTLETGNKRQGIRIKIFGDIGLGEQRLSAKAVCHAVGNINQSRNVIFAYFFNQFNAEVIGAGSYDLHIRFVIHFE